MLLVFSCKFHLTHASVGAFPCFSLINRESFILDLCLLSSGFTKGRGNSLKSRIWSSWMICLLGEFVAYVLDRYWFFFIDEQGSRVSVIDKVWVIQGSRLRIWFGCNCSWRSPPSGFCTWRLARTLSTSFSAFSCCLLKRSQNSSLKVWTCKVLGCNLDGMLSCGFVSQPPEALHSYTWWVRSGANAGTVAQVWTNGRWELSATFSKASTS